MNNRLFTHNPVDLVELRHKARESFLKRQQNPEARRQFLIDAEILTEDGKLNPIYFSETINAQDVDN